MITLNCDKCDKPFETENDAAGQKIECPYCGDINRVPASATPAVAAAKGRPVAVAAASAAAQPERTIMIVRQAMFRAHPFWYLMMVTVFIGGVALALLAQFSDRFVDARWLIWVGIGAAVMGLAWWVIWWAAPHRWVKLTITNRRTIRQEGIVMRQTSEVLHDHIRNVKIEQSVLERLLGVGSIAIDSAGGSETQLVEIEMKHVARPYMIKEVLDQHRRI